VTKIPNTPASQPDPVPQPMAERWLDVSFTHVFNGGLVGKDTSGMYTLGWDSAGVIWHHNWVHDVSTRIFLVCGLFALTLCYFLFLIR